MKNDFMNTFSTSTRASIENIEKFSAINLEAMQKLAAIQISLTNLNVASAAAQARIVTNASEPQSLLQAETELAKAYGEQLVKLGGETSAVLSDSREKLVSFTKDSLAPATEEKPARVAKKKTRSTRKVAKKTTRKVNKKAA